MQYQDLGVELTVGMTAEVEGNITVNDDAVNKMVAYIEKYHPDEATENKHEAEETKDRTVELLFNRQTSPNVDDAVIALKDKLSENHQVNVKACNRKSEYVQQLNADTFFIYFYVSGTRFDFGDVEDVIAKKVPGMISRVCGRIEAHLVDCRHSARSEEGHRCCHQGRGS